MSIDKVLRLKNRHSKNEIENQIEESEKEFIAGRRLYRDLVDSDEVFVYHGEEKRLYDMFCDLMIDRERKYQWKQDTKDLRKMINFLDDLIEKGVGEASINVITTVLKSELEKTKVY